LPILGYFFYEPTKRSLIGEKLPNLVTLLAIPLFLQLNLCLLFIQDSEAKKVKTVGKG
jgi:hypothetical protein